MSGPPVYAHVVICIYRLFGDLYRVSDGEGRAARPGFAFLINMPQTDIFTRGRALASPGQSDGPARKGRAPPDRDAQIIVEKVSRSSSHRLRAAADRPEERPLLRQSRL